MMDILFNGVGWTDIALALNRIALYAVMLIVVISVGAGPYSLDALILSWMSKHVA